MSKTLCAAPWVHFHVIADGNFYPCCQWNTDLPLGNIQTSSLKDLIDSPALNSIRSSMLQGQPVSGCQRCYQLEESKAPSLRQTLNKKFLPDLALTETDANAQKFKLRHFDVRFSNICNLKCRSCGLDFSSSWYEDQIALYGKNNFKKFITTAQSETFWQELNAYLPDITSVYFAGGEPLLEKRHFKMLQYFIDSHKTDIEINYTTNFTQLTFDKFKVLNYWRHFSNICIYASLDASGTRGEYLRKGLSWKTIEANIQRLKTEAPHVRFKITPTLSAYNVSHWPDFHREWIDNGWISANDIHTSYLTHPEPMSMQVLPKDFKTTVVQKYETHIQYLETLSYSQEAIHQFRSVIDFLLANDFSHQLPEFLQQTLKIDNLRRENLFETFPELAPLT